MDELHGHFAEWKKPATKITKLWFCLFELLEKVKPIEIKSRSVVSKGQGWEGAILQRDIRGSF